jgi:hypothetical protein
MTDGAEQRLAAPQAPAHRRSGITPTIVIATVTWGLLVIGASAAAHAAGITQSLCPLRRATGIPCPTCGGTRATFALARGHPIDALTLNPLVTIALVATIAVAVASLALRCNLIIALIRSRRFAFALLGAILANWVYLLVHGV